MSCTPKPSKWKYLITKIKTKLCQNKARSIAKDGRYEVENEEQRSVFIFYIWRQKFEQKFSILGPHYFGSRWDFYKFDVSLQVCSLLSLIFDRL